MAVEALVDSAEAVLAAVDSAAGAAVVAGLAAVAAFLAEAPVAVGRFLNNEFQKWIKINDIKT